MKRRCHTAGQAVRRVWRVSGCSVRVVTSQGQRRGAADAGRDRGLLGQLTETFVYQELKRQSGWYHSPLRFFHYRDKDGVEVDIVIERGAGPVAGIEVKASCTARNTRVSTSVLSALSKSLCALMAPATTDSRS